MGICAGRGEALDFNKWVLVIFGDSRQTCFVDCRPSPFMSFVAMMILCSVETKCQNS